MRDLKREYWDMKLQKELRRFEHYVEIAYGNFSNAGRKNAARALLPEIEARCIHFRELSRSVA